MATPLAPEIPALDTFGAPYRNADAPVDPETDLDAEAVNRLAAQVVMLSYAAPRAIVRVEVDSGGGTATVAFHRAVWGDTNAVRPTVDYDGVGNYLLTWAASYDDLQATPESHAVHLRAALASGFVATFVNADVISPTEVRVRSWDAAGAPADPNNFTVVVF